MPGYPIVLDLTGRRVVVVGLGAVGRRKARGLIEAGATVVGVDPLGAPEGIVPGLIVKAEPYRQGHLDGARLAIASATAEVNRQVVADARGLGVLVNASSDPAAGDFSVPSVWRDGPLLLSLSTTGAGPALAALLRDRAAGALGPAARQLAELLGELRPLAIARVADLESRRRLLRDWAAPDWLDSIAEEGPAAVRARMLAAIVEAAGPGGLEEPGP